MPKTKYVEDLLDTDVSDDTDISDDSSSEVESFKELLKLILLVLKTHQTILGKIFWVRVNEPNSIYRR